MSSGDGMLAVDSFLSHDFGGGSRRPSKSGSSDIQKIIDGRKHEEEEEEKRRRRVERLRATDSSHGSGSESTPEVDEIPEDISMVGVEPTRAFRILPEHKQEVSWAAVDVTGVQRCKESLTAVMAQLGCSGLVPAQCARAAGLSEAEGRRLLGEITSANEDAAMAASDTLIRIWSCNDGHEPLQSITSARPEGSQRPLHWRPVAEDFLQQLLALGYSCSPAALPSGSCAPQERSWRLQLRLLLRLLCCCCRQGWLEAEREQGEARLLEALLHLQLDCALVLRDDLDAASCELMAHVAPASWPTTMASVVQGLLRRIARQAEEAGAGAAAADSRMPDLALLDAVMAVPCKPADPQARGTQLRMHLALAALQHLYLGDGAAARQQPALGKRRREGAAAAGGVTAVMDVLARPLAAAGGDAEELQASQLLRQIRSSLGHTIDDDDAVEAGLPESSTILRLYAIICLAREAMLRPAEDCSAQEEAQSGNQWLRVLRALEGPVRLGRSEAASDVKAAASACILQFERREGEQTHAAV